MKNDSMVLCIITLLAISFAIYNGVFLVLKSGRTKQTTGTVISITMPNPPTAKARNSKWAILTYIADGKLYTSSNRIQVPMSTMVGSRIPVRYDVEKPDCLYSFSVKRILIAVGVAGAAILCLLAGKLTLI